LDTAEKKKVGEWKNDNLPLADPNKKLFQTGRLRGGSMQLRIAKKGKEGGMANSMSWRGQKVGGVSCKNTNWTHVAEVIFRKVQAGGKMQNSDQGTIGR